MPISYRPIFPKRTMPQKLKRVQRQFVLLMGDFVTEAQDELATYPPQRAGARRKRTGTLGRSWSHRVIVKSDQIVGVVGSQGQIAPYNVYVQGLQQRKGMKAIGWKTPKEVLKRKVPKMKARVRAVIKGAAR